MTFSIYSLLAAFNTKRVALRDDSVDAYLSQTPYPNVSTSRPQGVSGSPLFAAVIAPAARVSQASWM